MNVKNPFLSKTLWVNLVVGILAFFPVVSAHVSGEQVMLGMSVVNIILRLVTKEKIGLE